MAGREKGVNRDTVCDNSKSHPALQALQHTPLQSGWGMKKHLNRCCPWQPSLPLHLRWHFVAPSLENLCWLLWHCWRQTLSWNIIGPCCADNSAKDVKSGQGTAEALPKPSTYQPRSAFLWSLKDSKRSPTKLFPLLLPLSPHLKNPLEGTAWTGNARQDKGKPVYSLGPHFPHIHCPPNPALILESLSPLK